tara:strand:+ start:193 stop:1563 length:1371 start_codon:yes stop_codon:yes gene_type:complete
MKQLQRNQLAKKQSSSFTIENKITQSPISTNLVKKTNGFKIVSRGADNLLPYTISEIVKNSSTLSNIIYSKAEYVSSGEIIIDNEVVKDKLLEDLNSNYDFYELSKRLSIDYYSHGYAFIERVRIGSEIFVYHLPTERVCIEEFDVLPEFAVISKDWQDRKVKPYSIGFFPNETMDEDSDVETFRSIIMLKDYDVTNSVYGLPKWVGAFYDAQVESLIGQYSANHFENGITLSAILSIDLGEYNTPEDLIAAKNKLEKNIKGTSEGRSGKTLIHASNSGVDAPVYTVFPMEKEGSFSKLQETTENNIVKANQWFRSLAGLQTAGSLGNNQQLRNEWSLAEKQIKNMQYKITEAVFEALGIDINIDEIIFSNHSPIDMANELDIEAILTIEEKRGLLGLESEEKEKVSLPLNGAQVTSLVEVIKSYSLGELTENQAINIIKVALGITEKAATKLISK